MNDLTQKILGFVVRRVRWRGNTGRVLEVSCEDQMVKLSRHERRAMEEEKAKKQRFRLENGEVRVEEETEKRCGKELGG